MRAYNFGSSGHNLTKFYHGKWLIAGVITWTLSLQGMPTTKFGRVKTSKTFDFDRKYLRNGSTYRKSENYWNISSPIRRKKFGELWSTNQKVIGACRPTQLDFFRQTIFRPLGGAGLSNFYTPYNPLNVFQVGCGPPGGLMLGSAPYF